MYTIHNIKYLLRFSFLCICLGMLLLSCGEERRLKIFYPVGMHQNGFDTLYQTLIPFEVVNQEGDTVGTDNVLGSMLVVDFFFASCPSVCPAMSGEMSRVNEAFADEDLVRLLSFSIDPDRDSIPALKEYANTFGGEAGKWDFFRGEGEENRTLSQRAFYLTALRDTTAEGGFQHDPRMVLLDERGRIRGYYTGTDYDEVSRLIGDVKLLVGEYKQKRKK